jgi:hypothetical protein
MTRLRALDGDARRRKDAENHRNIAAETLAIAEDGLQRISTKGQHGIGPGLTILLAQISNEAILLVSAGKLRAIQEFGMRLHHQSGSLLGKSAAHGFAGEHCGATLAAIWVNDQEPLHRLLRACGSAEPQDEHREGKYGGSPSGFPAPEMRTRIGLHIARSFIDIAVTWDPTMNRFPT